MMSLKESRSEEVHVMTSDVCEVHDVRGMWKGQVDNTLIVTRKLFPNLANNGQSIFRPSLVHTVTLITV